MSNLFGHTNTRVNYLIQLTTFPSVVSFESSYDNALAETIIGLFKTEVIRKKEPWRNFETVVFAILEWIDWLNNRRLLEPIGDIPPAELEQVYYDQRKLSS